MAPKREAQTRENSSPSASQEIEARLEQQDLDDEKDGHDQGRDAEANGDEEKDDEKQDEDDAQEGAWGEVPTMSITRPRHDSLSHSVHS